MSTAVDLTLARHDMAYRQFDYWCRQGFIRVLSFGSGTPRSVPNHEAQVLDIMARLVASGVNARAAAGHARQLVDRGQTTLGGFVLRIQDLQSEAHKEPA